MSQINPFTGSILQSPQVQRQQATDKDRQVRKAQERTKNTGLAEDQVDHQVESSEAVTPAHQDDRHERGFKRSKHKPRTATTDVQEPGLDLTA